MNIVSPPTVSLTATGWLKDLDLLGIYVPPLLVWALLALIPFIMLRWLLHVAGFYQLVWHRPLFNMALYLSILSGVVLSGARGWF